jgi:hypothetical protein
MSVAEPQPADPNPERSRPQFSLAALLGGVTAVCVWLAILKMIGRGWPLLVFLTANGFLAFVYFRIFPRASGYGFGLVLLVANVVVAAVVSALFPFPQIVEWLLDRW